MKIVNGFYITAHVQKDGRPWIIGKISGPNDTKEYEFNALVFDEGSHYGIKGGRTSKLWLKQKGTTGWKGVKANYDRGWDIRPKSAKDKKMVAALLEYFNTLPTAEFWEGVITAQPEIIEYLRLPDGYTMRCRITIDNEGWGTIQDVLTYNWHGKLDPIAMWELLEERKQRQR